MKEFLEMNEEQLEKIKSMRESLREVKDEWLENKPKGGGKYLGVNTVRQILDNASKFGWSFDLVKEWKEEVYKYNKSTKGYDFDGYVYHVKGVLTIPFLGSRSQYGSKVAIGGANNQDSAYKAAASNCLNKCASLFGVGESVYSKFQIETGEEEFNDLQNNNAYQVGGYGQQQQQQQPDYNQQQFAHQPMQQQGHEQYGQQQQNYGGYPRQ